VIEATHDGSRAQHRPGRTHNNDGPHLRAVHTIATPLNGQRQDV